MTQLRDLYTTLRTQNTADHINWCNDLLERTTSGIQGLTLSAMFHQALADNANLDFIGDKFFTNADRANAQTVRTRVHDCLSKTQGNPITVNLDTGPYMFMYLGREFSPLRHLNLGWVDYFAKTDCVPVLGEVKCNDDQNPFYAFIQLLTYLSEMATPNQITRATTHGELQIDVNFPQKFDLHILLVDHQAFNPKSKRHQLIESTRRLAKQFKCELVNQFPPATDVVGNVLCLRMNPESFNDDDAVSLDCIWAE